MASLQSIRDNLVYGSGYVAGRSPHSLSDVYAKIISKLTTLVSLPLPFLSFLALPFFSGTSTTITVGFFYLTWTALVLSHDQLEVEIVGTLLVKLFCFVLPALAFVLFDSFAPKLSKGIKNRGTSQLPLQQLDRDKLLRVVGFAVLNASLSIGLQALLEFIVTDVLHVRSLLKVTSIVPLPWNILKDVAFGFAIRGVLIYVVHRYLLHTFDSPLKSWHLEWQHSVQLPFSLVAAYDHPANYLLMQWLPTFLPAYLFRFHVLTWHLFLALCSLEDLFVFSGYAALPSRILLLGMAERCDEHFAVVYDDKDAGNFGRTGILDFVCGTSCPGEDDAVDDMQAEAEKHNVAQRASSAINGAVAGVKGNRRSKQSSKGESKSSK